MRKYNIQKTWALLNRRTGEITDVEIAVQKERGRNFVKVWQDSGWGNRVEKLQGNSLRVLWYLVSIVTFQNRVPGPVRVSQGLGWKQPNVSRAYGELKEADFLLEREGVYYLNPYFCWKGNVHQFEVACQESFPKSTTEPTEELPSSSRVSPATI